MHCGLDKQDKPYTESEAIDPTKSRLETETLMFATSLRYTCASLEASPERQA